MTWEKERNLVKLLFPTPTLRFSSWAKSRCALSVFVKMGTREEIGEWSQAPRKGSLP